MIRTSQITNCIACGQPDVHLTSIHFCGDDAEFPICDSCEPYIQEIYGDPFFNLLLLMEAGAGSPGTTLLQRGGSLSFLGPAAPKALERLRDFDFHCASLGEQIQALRENDSFGD